MKKSLQILFPLIFSITTGCNVQEKLEKQEKAQKDADYIIENLDKEVVMSRFPEAEFPREQLGNIIGGLNANGDWPNRKGNFVDYTTMLNNGRNEVAYIYEYFLKCDSLRFILVYNIDEKEPKLFNFQVEPLEKHNPMVIHTEKQLLK